ncbi:hypothetical protein DFJ74DRAFT_366539 [Hyaloraphidium curvatum]|nr:hypothetical protein DFJ74DRAFT_366539 [Hyaloraphidium curvatum]
MTSPTEPAPAPAAAAMPPRDDASEHPLADGWPPVEDSPDALPNGPAPDDPAGEPDPPAPADAEITVTLDTETDIDADPDPDGYPLSPLPDDASRPVHEDFSDLPPPWAWTAWRLWAVLQAAGNAALLAPLVVAMVGEPRPVCSPSLFAFSGVQAALRGLQILFCVLLAVVMPREVGRITYRVHRKLERMKGAWVATVIITFAQIVDVMVGLGLVMYVDPSCRTPTTSPLLATTNVLTLLELSIFIAPAILVYILPCLSGFLLSLPANFSGATPAQMRRVRSVVVDPRAPSPPADAGGRAASAAGHVCPICLDEMPGGTRVKELPCGHRFHGACIGRHLEERSECPYCRAGLPG